MLFDWREFLIVAHELRNDPREGIQRTSIGRAYYYVYNLGLIMAKTEKFSIISGRGGMHKQLWYQSHTNPIIREMGIQANRMHATRISADYRDARVPDAAREVKTQLRRAQTFETLRAQVNGQTPPAALAP